MSRSKLAFKILLVISLFSALFACVGTLSACRKFAYELIHSDDQISKIELVIYKGGFVEGETIGEISVLKEITDVESFLNDFRKIEFQNYLPIGDPASIGEHIGNIQLILITYVNGDVEGVNCDVQFKSIEGHPRSFGFCVACEEDDFNSLFNLWMKG